MGLAGWFYQVLFCSEDIRLCGRPGVLAPAATRRPEVGLVLLRQTAGT